MNMNMNSNDRSAGIDRRRIQRDNQHGDGNIDFDIDIVAMIFDFWRLKKTIVGIATIFVVFSILFIVFQNKKYSSSAIVQINSQQTNVLNDMDALVSNMSQQVSAIAVRSEVDVLSSPYMAGLVVDKLNLMNNKEFNSRLEDDDYGDLDKEILRIKIINILMNNIDISMVPNSLTIKIKAISKSPRLAKKIANTMAEEYIEEQIRNRFKITNQTNDWLNQKLTELRKSLAVSEENVRIYREENDLFESVTGFTISDKEFSQISSQLIMTRADLAEARAKLIQITKLIDSGTGIESTAEVLLSPLIQKLREQEAELLREKADLSSIYGKKHPKMIKINAELNDLENKIALEVQRIVKSLENDVSIIETRESSLAESLSQAQDIVSSDSKSEIKLKELLREVKSNRVLYESFLTRSKETAQQSDLVKTDSRIISPAIMPIKPSHPRKALTLIAGIILGLGAGFVVAAIQLYMDKTFRTLSQIERKLGYAALGIFPLVSSEYEGLTYLKYKPTSIIAESLRKIFNSLRFSNMEKPPKIVMVTSSLTGEGKTYLTMCLAHIAVKEGLKVVVIDGDMRRAQLSNYLGLRIKHTIADVLKGDVDLSEAIVHYAMSSFDVITSTVNTEDSNKLMNSDKMDEILERLSNEYDLVLFDTPPIFALADSISLARKVDSTIFVVKYGDTDGDITKDAIKQLKILNLPVAGIVLSQVDLENSSESNYKNYSKYYNN